MMQVIMDMLRSEPGIAAIFGVIVTSICWLGDSIITDREIKELRKRVEILEKREKLTRSITENVEKMDKCNAEMIRCVQEEINILAKAIGRMDKEEGLNGDIQRSKQND